MNIKIKLSKQTEDDFQYWERQDKKTLRKINSLIEDIQKNGVLDGIGKPERLKHISGYSRRIDEKNRLLYRKTSDNKILIVSCKGHYETRK